MVSFFERENWCVWFIGVDYSAGDVDSTGGGLRKKVLEIETKVSVRQAGRLCCSWIFGTRCHLQEIMPLTPRSSAAEEKAHSRRLLGDLMKDLDAKAMRGLRQGFWETGGGVVNLAQFVTIASAHLPKMCKEDLAELFLEIDVNGDETLEWEELISFIVSKSSVYSETADTNEDASFHLPFKYIHRVESKGVTFNENVIRQLLYIEELDVFAIVRENSSSIFLHDARDHLSGPLGRLHCERGLPICASYVPSKNRSTSSRIHPGCLVTSNSNCTICLWELAPGENQFKQLSSWPTPFAQAGLCWISEHRLLLSSDVRGSLHLWNVETRIEKAKIVHAHVDICSCVIEIPGLDSVATAGMDSEVFIWDSTSLEKRHHLRGHKHAVYAAAYSEAHRFLVTGGIDHEAIVWSPFTSTMLFKLQGHTDSLCEIQPIASGSEHELVTGDCSGVLKLWDLRTFKCLQTFTDDAPHALTGMNSFAITKGNNPSVDFVSRIVAGHKEILIFDQRDPVHEGFADSMPVLDVLINETTMSILSMSARSVKIWDIFTGKLLQEFTSLMPSDTSAVCFDDRRRKFILGDHKGNISVFNLATGARMKKMNSHQKEISKLLYIGGPEKYLVSISWDRAIIVHSELEPNHGRVLREFDNLFGHEKEILCVDWNHGTKSMVTGSMDKSVRLWNIKTGKMVDKFCTDADVTAVQFLSELNAIAAANRNGSLLIWTGMKARKVLDESIAITAMRWNTKKKILYTGDEHGSIRAFQIEGADFNLVEKWVILHQLEDGITSIAISDMLNLLVTSSFDFTVQAFSLETGAQFGKLIQGGGRGMNRSSFWDAEFSKDILDETLKRRERHRKSISMGGDLNVHQARLTQRLSVLQLKVVTKEKEEKNEVEDEESMRRKEKRILIKEMTTMY